MRISGLGFVAALVALTGGFAGTARALTANATIQYSGGGCAICGGAAGGYACSPGDAGFLDPTPNGSQVTAIQATVYEVGCSGALETLTINGTSLGSFTPTANCACNSCDAAPVLNANNPNYVHGGSNILHWSGGGPCVAHVDFVITYNVGPKISPNPASFNFGNQKVGSTSGGQNFVITNTGGANLVISALGKNGPFNVGGPGLPLTVVPNGSATFTASFSPVAQGLVNGGMTLSSNDPNTPVLTIPLSGTGTQSLGSLNPMTVNFGNQNVSTVSNAANVTLTNTGNVPLNITAAPTVTGPFQLAGLANGMQVAAGGMAVFTVKFAPVAIGNVNGSVSIPSDANNSPTVLMLSGVGVGSAIAAAPNPANFGSQPIGGGGISQNVSLTNTGNGTLNISNLAIGGANAGDFMITFGPNLPAMVAPNAAVNVTVNFKPLGHGARAGTLVVTSDAVGMNMFSVPLIGTGTGPQLTAQPSPVQFGNANVNTSTMKTLTISNTGESNLIVNNYTFGGNNGMEFTSNAPVPFTLVPNGSSPVVITWKPTVAGARMGTIVLASNDPVNPTSTVNLLGTALSPMISFSSMSVDFGQQLVSTTSAPSTLTVTNTGNGPLNITNVVLGGQDAGQFQFMPGVFPVTLQPNATQDWTLSFAPMAVGKFNANLTFTSDDPMNMMAVIPVTGEGTSPMIAVDQATIDFGAQLVGHVSAQRTSTLSNTGTAPLTISAITLTGPQGADFMEVNPPGLPVTLMPGDKQPVVITLTPPMMGQELGTLQINSDDPNMPQVKVKLTGSGVSTVLSVSPMTVDFGVIKAPGTGTPQMITITNSGGDPVTLTDPKISGMSASAFTIDSPAGTLMPGEMKMVAAHAMAASAGDLSATATFAAQDNAIPPAAVMLTAKGVSALIVAMPSTLDFGNVTVGTTSPTQKVMVMNQSTSPVQLKSVVTDNPSFMIGGADTTSMIAAGMGTAFDVAFMPGAVGPATGKINITLVGGTAPEQVVMAMGTGQVASSPDMGTGGGGSNKSGGCSCSLGAGSRSAPPLALLGFLIAGIAVIRRRRR